MKEKTVHRKRKEIRKGKSKDEEIILGKIQERQVNDKVKMKGKINKQNKQDKTRNRKYIGE